METGPLRISVGALGRSMPSRIHPIVKAYAYAPVHLAAAWEAGGARPSTPPPLPWCHSSDELRKRQGSSFMPPHGPTIVSGCDNAGPRCDQCVETTHPKTKAERQPSATRVISTPVRRQSRAGLPAGTLAGGCLISNAESLPLFDRDLPSRTWMRWLKRNGGADSHKRRAGHLWSARMANPVNFPKLRSEPEQNAANIGDLVQWTSGGVDQFEMPKRVRRVETREGQEWAFVEGTETAVPMSELTVVTPASAAAASPMMAL